MKKLVSLTPLCFLILIVGCVSFMKKDYKKPYKTTVSSGETRPDTFSNKAGVPPKRSGYLASGSTVIVDTGEGDKRPLYLSNLNKQERRLCHQRQK